jgi:hypothetical protein
MSLERNEPHATFSMHGVRPRLSEFPSLARQTWIDLHLNIAAYMIDCMEIYSGFS